MTDDGKGTGGARTDRCPDLWWTGKRKVDGQTINDPVTIRDQNGLIVRTCKSAGEARNLVRTNNNHELARTKT